MARRLAPSAHRLVLAALGLTALGCSGGHDGTSTADQGLACQLVGSCTYFAGDGTPDYCIQADTGTGLTLANVQDQCATDAGLSLTVSASPCRAPGAQDSTCEMPGGLSLVFYAASGVAPASQAQVCADLSGQFGAAIACYAGSPAAPGTASSSGSTSGGGSTQTCSGTPSSCVGRSVGYNCFGGCNVQIGLDESDDTCTGNPEPCSEVGTEYCEEMGCTLSP
jgi:hypothetical protein